MRGYSVTMTSSAILSTEPIACDEPLRSYSRHDTRLDEELEMVPGPKRSLISSDIADEAVARSFSVERALPGP